MTTLSSSVAAAIIFQMTLGFIFVIPGPDLTVSVGRGQYGVAGVAGLIGFSEELESGPHTVFYWGEHEQWISMSFGALTTMLSLILACITYFFVWGSCRWVRRLPPTQSSPVLPRLCIILLFTIALVAVTSIGFTSGLADRETRALLFGLPIGIGYWISQLGLQSPIALLPLSYFAALIGYFLLPVAAIRMGRWSTTAIAVSVFLFTAALNVIGWNSLFTRLS